MKCIPLEKESDLVILADDIYRELEKYFSRLNSNGQGRARESIEYTLRRKIKEIKIAETHTNPNP